MRPSFAEVPEYGISARLQYGITMASGSIAAGQAAFDLPFPYVAYTNLRRLLVRLAEHPLPDRLRTEAWGVSAQIEGRLVATLRFLGLANLDLEPTLELRRFLKADATERRRQLAEILTTRYPWIRNLPPGTSYEQFVETLQPHSGYHGETLNRAAAFVIAAAMDLGLQLPVQPARRGRPAGDAGVHQPVARRALRRSGQEERRVRYFDFLMAEAERTSKNGQVDRDILDRLDRLVAL